MITNKEKHHKLVKIETQTEQKNYQKEKATKRKKLEKRQKKKGKN